MKVAQLSVNNPFVEKNSAQKATLITSDQGTPVASRLSNMPLPNQDDNSEQILLQRVAQDDSAAFFQLWLLHKEHIYRCCLQWMGSQMDAEDAVSEIMLRARQMMPRYADSILNLRAWLTKLGRNLCSTLHDKGKKYSQFFDNLAEIEKMAYDLDLLEQIHGREMVGFLSQGILNLPPRLREPAKRCFLLEESPQEVAISLSLSPALLRKRLQEARTRLQPLVLGYLWHTDGQSSCATPRLRGATPGLRGATPRLRGAEGCKINAQVAVTYSAVQICFPSGVRTFYVPLPNRPTRVKQKLDKLQKHLKAHPNGWKKRQQLADLLYAVGDWEEALAHYRQVQMQQPDLLEVVLQQGQILHLMERQDEATTLYQNALFRVCSVYSEASQHHLRGLMAHSRHDWEAAVKEFKAATSKEADNAAHWHVLGRVHLSRQAPLAALRAFDSALALNPNDLVALSESYDALMALGRFDEARQRVIKTHDLVPHDFLALTRLISERLRQGLLWNKEGEQTKKLIRIARRTTTPEAEALLANYHILRKKPKQGIKVLQKCLTQHPLNATAWYHYALCLFRTGTDLQGAADAIQSAYALDQNDPRIHQAAREILSAAGRS
ncbi:MAG: sigma-70 family RNA polymerase sigma factor [Ardenticatenaceae bacterium]